MKKFYENFKINILTAPKIIFILLLLAVGATFTLAHIIPLGCTGSGLGINLFTDNTRANIGDTISYSVGVFNGLPTDPVVCDASDIQASLVTPDGVNHPITLTRTQLSSGEYDMYTNVVTYIARVQDITAQGTLTATASNTGVIHQNITDSQAGANQGLNVFVLNTLSVIKQVVNTGGGTAVASDFSVHMKNGSVDVSGSPAPGAAMPGTSYELIPGTYTISEDPVSSYVASFSGDCDATGNVILEGGDNKTCTITNNYVPILPPTTSSINVVKTVVNDNGQTKVISDFPLFVNGLPVVSGVTNIFPANAAYTVTETSDPNYIQTFSGDCDATGHLSIVPGDIKVCVVTNNDVGSGVPPVPPIIDVVKVPSPLALPDGPGLVTYTYTLRNIGTVPVTDVTMVGDTCSPIILLSGDTNQNSILDLTEIWIYGCSTTLSETHTNTVTATGWASGISAVDVASATVVVDVPSRGGGGGGGSRPPLIHVTKIPNPLALPIGGGMVTYTETVTNPGVVALSNVRLIDDKCSPVNYISGDTDGDSRLDSSEAWVYTCRTNLTSTTTNTVVAEGSASGRTARDFAIATVVVAVPALPDTGVLGLPDTVVPGLPNTGFPPLNKSSNVALASILFLVSISLVIASRLYAIIKR